MKFLLTETQLNTLIIKINRPEVLNALNFEVVSEISETLDSISAYEEIKAIIITGEGDKSFCVGGDLKYVSNLTPNEAELYAIHVHKLLNKIENFDIPVIAAINGYALGGGCQLALACDLRLASNNAKIGQTEVTIGIPPGWGGTQRLARIVGVSKAKELIYTGRIISAQEAKDIGLVNEIIKSPKHECDKEKINNKRGVHENSFIFRCISFSESISRNNSFALKISKVLINKARDLNIEGGLLMERYGCSLCFTDIDREKLKSLLTKSMETGH